MGWQVSTEVQETGQDTEYDDRLAYSKSNWTGYRVRWQVSTQVRLLNSMQSMVTCHLTGQVTRQDTKYNDRSAYRSGYWIGYRVR